MQIAFVFLTFIYILLYIFTINGQVCTGPRDCFCGNRTCTVGQTCTSATSLCSGVPNCPVASPAPASCACGSSTCARGQSCAASSSTCYTTVDTTPPSPPPERPPGVARTIINESVDFCSDPANQANSFCLEPDFDCMESSFPKIGLNDSTIADFIVTSHNLLRSRVAAGGEPRGKPGPQPATRCMNKLVWDTDLAIAAQNWADQCKMEGDTSRDKDPSRNHDPFVGQNIFGFTDAPIVVYNPKTLPEQAYWDQAILSWYNEVIKFSNTKIGRYIYTAAASNYTQLVWGRTKKIGCGFRRWEISDDSGRFARILVCNYWPAGNVIGSPVYSARPSKTIEYSCPTCLSSPFNTFANSVLNGNLCVGGGGFEFVSLPSGVLPGITGTFTSPTPSP